MRIAKKAAAPRIDYNFHDFARHAKLRNNRNSSVQGKHDISQSSVAANRKLMTGMHYEIRSTAAAHEIAFDASLQYNRFDFYKGNLRANIHICRESVV